MHRTIVAVPVMTPCAARSTARGSGAGGLDCHVYDETGMTSQPSRSWSSAAFRCLLVCLLLGGAPARLAAQDRSTDRSDSLAAEQVETAGELDHPPCSPVADSTITSAEQLDPGFGWLTRPRPSYPSRLREAGIEGYVDLQFVVDAEGRVEPCSFRVLAATHPDFVAAATQALRWQRTAPPRRGGTPTRVRAQQRVSFLMGD